MSPRGRPLTQGFVRELAQGEGVSIVCGRFEGVDERVIAGRSLIEVSIGDYVLSGGEIAAMVLIDACVRLLPGVMGGTESGTEESFEAGLLEYPHYTRPREWEGAPSPTCCCRAITRPSPAGGARSRRWRSPASAARICSTRQDLSEVNIMI
jgi:tRNA (guanine37-N1)-methyltransferase